MVSGSLAPALYGGDFGDIVGGGISGGFMGGISGAVMGGVSGGLNAVGNDRDFWSGNINEIGGIPGQQIPTTVDTKGDVFSNPTGLDMRGTDSHGSGSFGAPRGSRNHLGIDIISEPGQEIMSPVNGIATNFKGATTGYSIVDIVPQGYNSGITKVRILYVDPPQGVQLWKPYPVQAGKTVIGRAVNLLSKGYYPRALGMTNHIHIFTFLDKLKVNPTPFFFPN